MQEDPQKVEPQLAVAIPEVQEILEELENDMLMGIYPFTRTPLLHYQSFQKSLYTQTIHISDASLQEIPDAQPTKEQPAPKQKKYLFLFAFLWVSVYVVIGALYTGLTFLYVTYPFMLRFSLANLGCLFFFLIQGIKEVHQMGLQEFKNTIQRYKAQKKKVVLTIIFYTISQISYVFPMKYTTVAQNALLVQCTSICIVIWKLINCIPTHFLAIFGSVIGLFGCGMTILDIDESNDSFSIGSMAIGNLMSLVGAAAAAAYTIHTYSFMKENFPVCVFSSILTSVCVVSGFVLCFIFEKDNFYRIE